MKRVAVAYTQNPADPAVYSGLTNGVMRGLREIGIDPIPVVCGPQSERLRSALIGLGSLRYLRPCGDSGFASRSARRAASSLGMAEVNSWLGRDVLRRSGRLDGIIQIGPSFALSTDLPLVTYDDMTAIQARNLGYPSWRLLSDRTLTRLIARQRGLYETATACCVATPWAFDSVVADYGVAAERVHVVGVGANFRAFGFGRDWSQPRFLFVGMDWERKNGEAVVRAFARLRRTVPNARLDVVGGHPRLSEAGVTGHGVLSPNNASHRRQLRALYTAATCLVVPSHAEAAGIVYVDAAAAGLPVIGSALGGAEFLIGEGGFVVRSGDDGALLSAMIRLSNPVEARAFGGAALRRSQLFTWANVARRLVHALRGALANDADWNEPGPAEW